MECWQRDHVWVFQGHTQYEHAKIVSMCKQTLGKSHGAISTWWVGHDAHPSLPMHPPLNVVFVRDSQMATMLRLMW